VADNLAQNEDDALEQVRAFLSYLPSSVAELPPRAAPARPAVAAERLRTVVFSMPFDVNGESIRLSACFGIAVSRGRAPVVVLREAEKALESAKAAGPESIQCFGSPPQPLPSPATFLSATAGNEFLTW